MTRGPRWRALVGLAVLLALATGCGVPTDSRPRPLAADARSTTTTPDEGGCDQTFEASDPRSVALYFSGGADEKLVAVRRGLSSAPTPRAVLRILLAGPTPEEQSCDVASLIPPETRLLGSSLGDGILRVNLSEEWASVRGTNQLAAYAQIVLSVTDVPGVKQVRFLVAGDGVAAPTATSGTEDIVTRADYRLLDPS